MRGGSVVFHALVIALLVGLSLHVLRPLSLYYYGLNPGPMHGVHLVFHEAGHVLFAWGPRLLHMLGGTIGQVAMPLVLVLAFVVGRRYFDAAACAWWVGHSLADCAPYIADARALRLPLITGYTGAEAEGHDWKFIMGRLDLAMHDQQIAAAFLNTGRVVMVVAILACIGLAAWSLHRRRASNTE